MEEMRCTSLGHVINAHIVNSDDMICQFTWCLGNRVWKERELVLFRFNGNEEVEWLDLERKRDEVVKATVKTG